jgi:Sap-like sulfolipid-1-addressing protein
MPANALALAFGASIYPPAVAAVVALGRGSQLRSRVFAFVAAAFLVTYASGTIMLLLLEELGATGPSHLTASAGLDLALGALLVALAVRLLVKRPRPSSSDTASQPRGPSKIDRYLTSRRLAALLGVTLYIVPSPIYVGAVKAIADAKLSTASELVDLVGVVAVMLWMVEVPMLCLLLAPEAAERALEQTNRWFARHGRTVATIASTTAGGYLIIKGVVGLDD